MENLLAVTFEAHNPALNHHRRYGIRVGRDLFGEWTVSICYGRSGRGGQLIHHSGSDPLPLRALVRDCLRRRLSAPRRIGCYYRLTDLDFAEDFDIGFWLPEEIISVFH